MKYSTVPPFKIFFNVNLDGTRNSRNTNSKSIGLTGEKIELKAELFEHLRDE